MFIVALLIIEKWKLSNVHLLMNVYNGILFANTKEHISKEKLVMYIFIRIILDTKKPNVH